MLDPGKSRPMKDSQSFVAFMGHQLVARGSAEAIVLRLYPLADSAQATLRLLDEATGRAVDFDWRGRADEVVARVKQQLGGSAKGRPKLGVESREITLLPRHWTWLEAQGKSVSATLRYLIDQAIGQNGRNRNEIDALYRQMSALAGDLPGFEEATRRLYALDWNGAERIVAAWPGDIGSYVAERLRALAVGGKESP